MNYNYEQFMETFYPERVRLVRTNELQQLRKRYAQVQLGCASCAPMNYNRKFISVIL